MTPRRRIFLNIVATYLRSLYALVIGLFCGRWTLMALGKIDYGLLGLIGGLTVFISFINSMMASSIGRYFAVAVGKAGVSGEDGVEECRKWFTAAVTFHTIVPFVLVIIGYPIGHWAVTSYLNIPPDRVSACVWVWRFVCVSCLIGMVSVPFNAMYRAKQYIAELTIYSFVTTTLNVVVLYYMINHPRDWLAIFSFWTVMLSLAPHIIIAIRAVYLFPECRFRWRYARCWRELTSLGSYAMWSSIGSFGSMLASQGSAILLNLYYGAKLNAAKAVGGRLSGRTHTLCGSMTGAFAPAIQNAYGAGNYELMRRLAYQVCKIGTLLILVFAIPLALEVDEVLVLWLKDPPEYAAFFCIYSMCWTVIDRTSYGHMIAVHARGKIALYQAVLGGFVCLSFPIMWVCFKLGLGVWAIAIGGIGTQMLCAWGRVFFAKNLVGMGVMYWLVRILLPLAVLMAGTLAIGCIPRFLMTPSFMRVVVTTIMVETIMIPFAWFVLLDCSERSFFKDKFVRVISRFKGGWV